MKEIATAKTFNIYISISILITMFAITWFFSVFGGGFEKNMFFSLYGDFIYIIIFVGPIPVFYPYYRMIRYQNSLISFSEKSIFIYQQKIDIIQDIIVYKNNIFGKKIKLTTNRGSYIFYQFMINEPLDIVRYRILNSTSM